MSERYTHFPEELQPGTIIEVGDSMNLSAFEDSIYPYVMNDSGAAEDYREYWEGRLPLKDMLRPAKFNGRITNIDMEVTEDPLERLEETIAEGRSILGNNGRRTGVNPESARPEDYLGFKVTADAMSSGKGRIGGIESELWYKPLQGSQRFSSGLAISRFVAVPKIDHERFREADELSRRIGLTVLRHNLQHPYRG